MAQHLMDLASPVFVFVAYFLRSAEHGADLPYEAVRHEAMEILREQEHKSQAEPELAAFWEKAKHPLIYLVDEAMVITGAWDQENKTRWENDNLETGWLGEDQTLRGERFYTKCDEALTVFRTANRLSRQDLASQEALLEVFYICLKLGLKGRLAASPADLATYTSSLFANLSADVATRTTELFPDVTKQTIKDKPVYGAMLRLSTVIAVFAGLLLTYVVATRMAWNALTSDVEVIAERIVLPIEPIEPAAGPDSAQD